MRERSVTRAAARVSLTQPTVSAALARLRVLFDDELFVKTGRTMRPTPFAETLAVRVAGAVRARGPVASHAAFDPRHDEQTFRILAPDYTALILIQPLMEALATEAPNVRISLESRDLVEHAPRLQRSEIDLAIVPDRFSRVTVLPSEPLFTDRFVAAAWRENTEVGDPLTFERLKGRPNCGCFSRRARCRRSSRHDDWRRSPGDHHLAPALGQRPRPLLAARSAP